LGSQGSSGSSHYAAVGQAPAYLVSAFLDTRPVIKGRPAEIAVIMAIDKRIMPQG
jgi:hypothetical protein